MLSCFLTRLWVGMLLGQSNWVAYGGIEKGVEVPRTVITLDNLNPNSALSILDVQIRCLLCKCFNRSVEVM